jgi:hypothetical protein
MSIDLTGGLDEHREFVCERQPADPDMRESVNVWVWDERGELGMPRVGVEAVADQWETHDVQVNIALVDGRVLNVFAAGPVHDPLGPDGRPRVLGAGPLSFELIEPFRHWRARIAGPAVATSTQAQIDGWMPGQSGGDLVAIEAEIDIVSAVPPWENGALRPEAAHVLATQEEGALMGGPRFEQLFRATGTVRIGDDVRELRGGDNEAFVFEGDGELVPARVLQAPWLRTLQAAGEDVTVVLESERGVTAVQGETVLSTFMVMPPDVGGGLDLQQAIVRYTWEGETAHGMLERSSLPDAMG